jgi:hypothetical protein
MMFRFAREYFPRNAVDEGWLGDQVRIELGDAIHTELAVLGSRSVMKDGARQTRRSGRLGRRQDRARCQLASSVAEDCGRTIRPSCPTPISVRRPCVPRVLKGELPAETVRLTARGNACILNEIRRRDEHPARRRHEHREG